MRGIDCGTTVERNYYPTDPYDRRHLQPWHHEAASVSFLASFILATEQELDGTRESGLVVSNDGKTTKIPWLVILPLTEDRDKTWAAHIIAVDHVESLPAKQRSS